MTRRTFLVSSVIASISWTLATTSSPLSAQEARAVPDSVTTKPHAVRASSDSVPRFWRIGATEDAADVVLDFKPDGTLYFRGGFREFSPAKWSYSDRLRELTVSLPRLKRADVTSLSGTLRYGEYKQFDAAKKTITYAFTPDTARIALFGYYFFPEHADSELYLIQFYNTAQWCAYRTRAAWVAAKDSLLASETSSAETIGTVSFKHGALSGISLEEFDDPGAGDWFVQDTYSFALNGKLSSLHRLQNVLPDDYSREEWFRISNDAALLEKTVNRDLRTRKPTKRAPDWIPDLVITTGLSRFPFVALILHTETNAWLHEVACLPSAPSIPSRN